MIGAATVLSALAVGGLTYYLALGMARSRPEDRLASMARSHTDLMSATFAERAVDPLMRRLGRFALRLSPQGWAERAHRRLQLAGLDRTFDPNAWAAIKVLSIGAALVGWLVLQALFLESFTSRFFTLLLLGFMGVFAPDAVVTRRSDDRREAMRRQLPDILDLLVISVEAGLSFDAALTRVVTTVPGEMSDEFRRMLQETRVGMSRTEGMRHLSERTDLDELRSFLLAMQQAETFGVSVSRVLRVQADEMRVKRRQRAQERAFTAPVKMVFPLVFCVLPALFIVLLGPAAIEIWENFIND